MENDKFKFVANVFHELKDPLTTIRIACEILKTDTIGTNDANYYISTIYNACGIMTDMLDRTIMSLKGDYYDINVNEVCNIHEILERTVSERNHVNIDLFMMASSPMVRGNKKYIESAVRELIDNAVKFKSNKELHINISTLNKGNKVIICFSDNGIGIDEEKQKKIFEKDYHDDSYDNLNNCLGLYITKINLQRISGTIAVESKPKRGTLFSITLPIIV